MSWWQHNHLLERRQWEEMNVRLAVMDKLVERGKTILQEIAMPKVSDMIQSKFLRKEDFEEDQVCTIKGLRLEDMPGDDGQQKWVLYFREMPKGMALNVTSIRVLEKAYGDDSDMWIGKRVMVYVDPNVSFGGRVVGGLRLRTPKNVAGATAAPAPAPVAADPEFDDDIPF